MPTFTPPTQDYAVRTGDPLFDRVKTTHGKTVVNVAGTWTDVGLSPLATQVAGEDGVDYFLGGHTYEIDSQAASELVADGFSAYVGAATLLTDDFSRADSSTDIGGEWTLGTPDGVFGITGGKAYVESAGSLTYHRAMYDTGNEAIDFTITVGRTTTNDQGYVIVAYNPSDQTGYVIRYDSSDSWANIRLTTDLGGDADSFTWNSAWTGGETTIRVTYDGVGVLTIYQDGVLAHVFTDPSPFTGASNTYVGFGSSSDYATTGDTWDDVIVREYV